MNESESNTTRVVSPFTLTLAFVAACSVSPPRRLATTRAVFPSFASAVNSTRSARKGPNATVSALNVMVPVAAEGSVERLAVPRMPCIEMSFHRNCRPSNAATRASVSSEPVIRPVALREPCSESARLRPCASSRSACSGANELNLASNVRLSFDTPWRASRPVAPRRQSAARISAVSTLTPAESYRTRSCPSVRCESPMTVLESRSNAMCASVSAAFPSTVTSATPPSRKTGISLRSMNTRGSNAASVARPRIRDRVGSSRVVPAKRTLPSPDRTSASTVIVSAVACRSSVPVANPRNGRVVRSRVIVATATVSSTSAASSQCRLVSVPMRP